MSMIAGLSDSAAIRRQFSENSPSLVFTPRTDRRTVVNLGDELNTAVPRDTSQATPAAEVTSTGTNTTSETVVTEDQATETGRQHCRILHLLFLCFILT